MLVLRKAPEVDIAYGSGDHDCLARLAEAGVRSIDGLVRVVVPFGCGRRERRLHFASIEIDVFQQELVSIQFQLQAANFGGFKISSRLTNDSAATVL